MRDETNEFAACETTAEVIVVTFRMLGLDAVDRLLSKTEIAREDLQRDADGFEAIGMKALASVLRRHARKAKRAPPTWEQRMRIKERQHF